MTSQVYTSCPGINLDETGLQRWKHIPTGRLHWIGGLRVWRGKVTVIKFYDIKWFSCQCMRRMEANEKNKSGGNAQQIKLEDYTC